MFRRLTPRVSPVAIGLGAGASRGNMACARSARHTRLGSLRIPGNVHRIGVGCGVACLALGA
eukprot:9489196-Pyramimonas_sp.AAC.1